MSVGQWREETPEEVIEAIRRADGDEAAELAARAMGWKPAPRKKFPKRRAGEKERRITPSVPVTAKGDDVIIIRRGTQARRRGLID